MSGTPSVKAVDERKGKIARKLREVVEEFPSYESDVAALPVADQAGRWVEDIAASVSAEIMKGHVVDTTGLSGIFAYAKECGARRRVHFTLDFPNNEA